MKLISSNLKISFFFASIGSLTLGVLGGVYAAQYYSLGTTSSQSHVLATSDAFCPPPSQSATTAFEAQSSGEDGVFTSGCGGIF